MSSDRSESDVLTLSEVAALLKVHPNTVYRLARSGKLPAFKIGTDWRFLRSAVEAFMQSRPPKAGRRSEEEDQALHLIYWMLSNGFSLSPSREELGLVLDWTPRVVKASLDALSRRGYITVNEGRVALTPDGMATARSRFGARARTPSGHESVREFAERFVGP